MNQPLPRGVFLMTLAASGAALTTAAQAQALLDEKDAQAVALGDAADARCVAGAGWCSAWAKKT